MRSKKILVIGSRGVGKTTVISYLHDYMAGTLRGAGCQINMNSVDEERLRQSRSNLNLMLDSKYEIEHRIEPTEAFKKYQFKVIDDDSGKKVISYEITDHPGGYLAGIKKGDSNNLGNELIELFNKAGTILYVIDSPYYMEHLGRYNEERNQVTSFMKIIENCKNELYSKKIIFVLAKCEKYVPSKLVENFHSTYSPLLRFLEDLNYSNYSVLPVETIGGVVFESFEFDTITKLPISIYKRKYPNSKIENKNLDVLANMVLSEIIGSIKPKIFLFMEIKTKKVKRAERIAKKLEEESL